MPDDSNQKPIQNAYLLHGIATLKARFPEKIDHIDDSVKTYLAEDGPPAADEFLALLTNRLEGPKPHKKAVKSGRHNVRRNQR